MSLTSLLSDNPGTLGVPSRVFPFQSRRVHSAGPIRIVTAEAPASPGPSAHPVRISASASASLGTASAFERWQWAGTVSVAPIAAAPVASVAPAPKVAAVRIPPLLLEEMSTAAHLCGRSLSDIWAEAAREWLRRHAHEHEPEPQPPTPAAAALAVPRPTRSWAAIDTVLAELRRSPDSAA